MNGPSAFGLIAVGLYCAVGVIGAIAARRAQISGQAPRHAWLWLLLVLVFALLALSRLTMAEEWLREWLRAALQGEALYDRRRAVQLPLSFLTMAVALGSQPWLGSDRRGVGE